MGKETDEEINQMFTEMYRKAEADRQRLRNESIKMLKEQERLKPIKDIQKKYWKQVAESDIREKEGSAGFVRLMRLVTDQKFDEVEKELAKLNKPSTITLAKIPKVPKVPKFKPITTLKSNAKIIKEIDDLVREVEELEHMAIPKKKVTLKSSKKAIKDVDDAIKEISKMKRIAKPKKTEIETVTETKIARPEELKVVKKRGRPPKVKTETDVEAVVSKPKRGRPRKTPVEPEKPKQTKKDIKISEDLDAKTRAKRANAIDVLKTKFNHFRRSLRYLPNTKEEFKNESVEQRLDDRYYYDEAVKLLTEANAKYREYKSEGLITKEDLDKIMDLFEYEEYRKKYLLFKSIFE